MYCANNPLKFIDPTGMDWYRNADGTVVLWQREWVPEYYGVEVSGTAAAGFVGFTFSLGVGYFPYDESIILVPSLGYSAGWDLSGM